MKPFLKKQTHILLKRVPPSENLVAFYADEKLLINEMVSFAKVGLEKNETVVIVALPRHIRALEDSLIVEGLNVFGLKIKDQLLSLDADAFLDKFMVNGAPDEALLRFQVVSLALKVLKSNRNVRIFSELSASLWLRGLAVASAHLEAIWNKLVLNNTEFPGVTLTSEVLDIPSQPLPVKTKSRLS